MADRIIEMVKSNPKITQIEMAEQLDVSYRTLQRKMDDLKDSGKIARKGGKRYGYWEIN